MLRPLPKRGRDWFIADEEVAKPLLALDGGVPGVTVKWDSSVERPAMFEIHRSHLPLCTAPDAIEMLARMHERANQSWDARNTRTEALGITLRTTQHQAIDFITDRAGTLLGDDMRLGKTLSAAMSHDPKDGPLVVIAPLSARGVWLSWLRRVFPGEDIGVMAGKKFDREQASKPIVFGHYDILAQWQTVMPIGTLVFDEAHLLTNRRTKRTEAAFILRQRARRVIAMTGTPIWNMPPDLWAVLALVAPGAWGGYYDFGDRYGAPVPTAYGKLYTGASNTEELRARMTEVMLRRRWRDCMADLPPIQRTVHVVEINDIQRKKLDIVMGSLRTERTNTASHLAQYRREVSFVKTKLTCERVQKHIETGNPVVVWTWHKELADRLGSLLDAFVIHGDVSPNKRDEIIEQWKASPTPRVLVATWSVGQVAIDLSHAPVAIAPEIDWTPAIIGQGEMRIFSPLRPMLIEYIIVNHIVEQRMVRALISKLGAADPLGVGAAVDTIDALRDALLGPQEAGDLDRLMEDLLASAA